MKNKKMTRWGVGPQFALISCIYVIIIFILNYVWFSNLLIPISPNLSLIFGIILIVLGLPVFLIPAFTIDKYFKDGKLVTKGIYRYFRHPIYASWIIFFVPGIILIKGSLLGLTIPFFMYFIFKILIKNEEDYLERKFGEKYLQYKKRVGTIFPKLF